MHQTLEKKMKMAPFLPVLRAPRKFSPAYVLAVSALLAWLGAAAPPAEVRLHGLYPQSVVWDGGLPVKIAAELAIEEINANPNLLPGTTIVHSSADSTCSKRGGVVATLDAGRIEVLKRPADVGFHCGAGPGCRQKGRDCDEAQKPNEGSAHGRDYRPKGSFRQQKPIQ